MTPEVEAWLSNPARIDANRQAITTTQTDAENARAIYTVLFSIGSMISDLARATKMAPEDRAEATDLSNAAVSLFTLRVMSEFSGSEDMINRILQFASWAGTPISDVREDDKHDA